MKELEISIIIPLFNHEKFISEAIESILKQKFTNYEVIIIDDGSTDNSYEKLKDYCYKYNNISYHYQKNFGAHNAINRGIRKASGNYIYILNSDDVYAKDRLSDIQKIFRKNSNISAVFSEIEFIDDKSNKIVNNWYNDAVKFYQESQNLPVSLINGNFIMTTSNLAVKKDVINKLGIFNNLRYAHDLDFFLRLIIHNNEIFYLKKKSLKYRIHSANTINENVLRVKLEWALVIAFYLCKKSELHSDKLIDTLKQNEVLFPVLEKHTLTNYVITFMQYYSYLYDKNDYYNLVKEDEILYNYLLSKMK